MQHLLSGCNNVIRMFRLEAISFLLCSFNQLVSHSKTNSNSVVSVIRNDVLDVKEAKLDGWKLWM